MHTGRLRLIVFIIFFLGFLSTISIVLFFTFGYRFNFDRGIFVYTGSITVKPIPSDVTISIDGSRVEGSRVSIINDSIHMTGIDPGEHFLRIEAEGYRSWEKKVRVESGVSTEFWNVVLARQSYDVSRLAPGGPYRGIYPSPDGRLIALSGDKDGESLVVVVDLDTGDRRQVFSSKRFAGADPENGNVEWSSDNRFLAVPLSDDGVGALAVVDIADGSASFSLPDRSVPGPGIRFPRFRPDRGDELVYLDGLTLTAVGSGGSDSPTTVAESVAAFDLSGRALYTLDAESGIVSRSGFAAPIEGDPVFDPIPDFDGNVRLVVYDRDHAAVYEEGSGGWLLRTAEDPLSFGTTVRTVQFSDDGKKLLITETDEVSVLFTEDWDEQPSREEGERQQILRLASGIRSAVWSEDYEHVIFSAEDGLSIAELDPRGGRFIQQLSDAVAHGPVVTLFADNLILLLVGADDERSVYAIEFPRPQPLFGK